MDLYSILYCQTNKEMLKTNNIDEISSINLIPKLINKRIKKECQDISNKYNITVECTIEGDILVTLNRNEDTYMFNIPSNYPFSPPKLTMNGLNIKEFFDLKTKRFKNLIKYVGEIECMCCNTYLCPNNWNPALTFDKIINQINHYKNIKYLIMIKLMADQIKLQYLNSDIDLDSWLFTLYDRNPFHLTH